MDRLSSMRYCNCKDQVWTCFLFFYLFWKDMVNRTFWRSCVIITSLSYVFNLAMSFSVLVFFPDLIVSFKMNFICSGLDLFAYNSVSKSLDLVETRKSNVSWYVYTHESRLVLLASGMQCRTFTGFQVWLPSLVLF